MDDPPFCGRDRELSDLLADWDAVQSGRGPRVAAILGEPGLGKTKLAQMLYVAIAARDANGYWPPVLGRLGNNLQVNPSDFGARQGQPPYFWWGLRLVDPFDPNSVGAGVLASSVENHLRPQLAPFLQRQRSKERRGEAFSVGKGLAIDFAIDFAIEAIPFGGLAKTIGEAGLDLHRIYREDRVDRSGLAAESLIGRTLADLELAIAADSKTPRPAVVLVDDAQFSHHDPGVTAFVSELLERAISGAWPLLVVLTHWEREWDAPDTGSIAAALKSLDLSDPPRVLRLAPLSDLAPVLDAALPGLTEAQRDALLAQADGNPRYLSEIILFATGARGLFVRGDTTGPLTENGLIRLLSVSTRLHDLTAQRLRESPWEVQEAVCLATLQGIEFLEAILDRTAAHLRGDGGAMAAAVAEAERPHAWLRSIDTGIAAFAQRIYYQVASELFQDNFDPDEARQALENGVRELARSDLAATFEGEERRRFLTLAAALFEDAEPIPDRMIAASCLHELGLVANREGDVHAFRSLADRLDALILRSGDDVLDSDLNWLRMIYYAASGPNAAEVEARVVNQMCRLTGQTLAEVENDWAIWMHVRALALLAQHHLVHDATEPAIEAAWHANNILQEWPLQERSSSELWAWIDVYGAIARAMTMLGDPAKAIEWHEGQMLVTERMLDLTPDDPDILRMRAWAEQRAGRLAWTAGEAEVAHRWLEASVARFRDLAAEGEVSVEFPAALINLAVAIAGDDPSGAADLRAEALQAARELVKLGDDAENRHLLAWVLFATARESGSDTSQIADLAMEAAALHRKDRPHEAAAQAEVARIEGAAGAALFELGRPSDALPYALRACDLARQVVASDSTEQSAGFLLAALVLIVRIEQALGEYGSSALHLDEGKKLIGSSGLAGHDSLAEQLHGLADLQPSLH